MGMVARSLAAALGLLGGVTASQGPEFSQQYRQRLGGAVDELQRVVDRFHQDARTLGQTPESALAQLRSNPDALVRRQGEGAVANTERLARLRSQRDAMAAAGPFERMGVMARELDPAIARAAWRDFEPAVPVTREGAITAGIGFATLWAGTLLLAAAWRHWRRRRRRARRMPRIVRRREPTLDQRPS